MEGIINLLFVFMLLVVGYFSGKWFESRHYRNIRDRELKFHSKPAVTLKTVPSDREVQMAVLVTGSVVISVDYFKRFLATLRNIFGGEMASYSSLIDRGRREAILRMKESHPDADLYVNMRLETSTISSGKGKSVGCVEVVAYGTAIVFS